MEKLDKLESGCASGDNSKDEHHLETTTRAEMTNFAPNVSPVLPYSTLQVLMDAEDRHSKQ